jgi:hypothetical protein
MWFRGGAGEAGENHVVSGGVVDVGVAVAPRVWWAWPRRHGGGVARR